MTLNPVIRRNGYAGAGRSAHGRGFLSDIKSPEDKERFMILISVQSRQREPVKSNDDHT